MRKIRSLCVSCPNKNGGCPWTGELQSVDSHISQCPKRLVECYLNCGSKVRRCNLTVHCTKECSKRTVPCQYCAERGEHDFITAAHLNICPRKVVNCRNIGCTVQCERRFLSEHSAACPKKIVSCSNHCGIQLKLEDLNNHLAEKCSRRKIPCQYCSKRNEHRFMNKHYSSCLRIPIACSNVGCSAQFERQLQKVHSSTCPKEVVTCRYSFCSKKIKREEEKTHYQENLDYHLYQGLSDLQKSTAEALNATTQQLQSKLSEVQDALKKLTISSPYSTVIKNVKFFQAKITFLE